MKTVYLAGPIAGTKHNDSNNWREFVKRELLKYGIQGTSPRRHKGEINNPNQIMADHGQGNMMTTEKALVTRDRYDVTNCDVLFGNLLNAKSVSIGTMIEYGWADLLRKPIITVMEKQGNPHDHTFVRETTGYRVETLEDGLFVARAILTP